MLHLTVETLSRFVAFVEVGHIQYMVLDEPGVASETESVLTGDKNIITWLGSTGIVGVVLEIGVRIRVGIGLATVKIRNLLVS